MTPKQANLLRVTKFFWEEHGYAPSIEELRKLTKSSPATVHYQLKLLEQRGYIIREPNAHRSIRVVAAF